MMMTPKVDYVVHIAGLDVRIGNQLRQRCAWCGAVIEDWDLERTQGISLDGSPPQPPPTWAVGALVAVGEGITFILDHEAGTDLPPTACGQLPHDVTGIRQ